MSAYNFDDLVQMARSARAYRAYAAEGYRQIRENCCEMSMYDIRDAEAQARWNEARLRREADAALAKATS